MECTQRLECTQELYGSQSEKLCSEQIGFLGICGKKYPVKKGPNKIGRDPQTCNIILNLNSVSRQHAVINILNKKDFMLMDLDSANKTKLLGKTLQPYIPHPLHNGDTVQFGEIFGIFRLLEEEDDLPMTQAINIPDTPVPIKHMAKVNAVTTIPESPDVSDRDDSFIIPSQPKQQQFQSPKTRNFIKPGKTISIQPVGTNKIDNIYWSSSKKSTSMGLDDSNNSLTNDIQPIKLDDRRNEVLNDLSELKTQETCPIKKICDKSSDTIHTVDTEIPELEDSASTRTGFTDATSSPSIHSLNTQMTCGTSPSIHTLDTQLPPGFNLPSIHTLETQIPSEYLPELCKVDEQQDMHFDLYAKNDINDIHNAETQMFPAEKENIPIISQNLNDSDSNIKPNHKLNMSNEEALFDEVDNQFIEEGLESQAILSEDIDLPVNKLIEPEFDSQSQIIAPKGTKRNMRIESDSSTDCEDFEMIPPQKNLEEKGDDDDVTDCEELGELKADINDSDKAALSKTALSKTADCFEDLPTQVITVDEKPSHNTKKDVDFEDMPTQVIDNHVIETDAVTLKDNCNTDIDFEELPTQVLDEDEPPKQHCNNQHFSNEESSPFKIPFTSPLKSKKKDRAKTPKIKPIPFISKTIPSNADNDRYYQDTQDIYEDLCTQKLDSVEMGPTDKVNLNFPVIEKEKSFNNSMLDTSIDSVESEQKVKDFVSNLSGQEVRDMIGVDTQVTPITKVPSDGSTASDVEVTPKKLPFRFMDIDLPNSQEIKTSVTLSTRSMVTESSSESDTENNSEDQCTPILFRKKKKLKPDAKKDLTKKFDVDNLPSRIITRVRKPTVKLQDKKASDNILKPKFMVEQECEIDKEIITENISRLKSKNEKVKNVKSNIESNKESKQVGLVTENAESEMRKNVSEKNFQESKDLSKNDKIKQKEPKTVQKEIIASKNQFMIPVNSTKETFDLTVQNDKVQSVNKSKDIGSLQIDVVEENLGDKKKRSCRKKLEEDRKEKVSRKDEKREKRELKNIQKESTDSKTQSSVIGNITKQSIDASVEINNKTRSSYESKVVETFDLTESLVDKKRNTRNSNAKVKTTKTDKESAPPAQDSQTEKPAKRKYTRKQEPKSKNKIEVEKEPSPVKDVRRSKRQRTVKNNKAEVDQVPKSILKKSLTVPHEESTVYNMSSSSNSDSSRSYKRPALNHSEMPSPKRTRSTVVNNTSPDESVVRRRRTTPYTTRMAKTQYVLFTAFPFEAVKVKLENMGAVVVTDIMKSTVILTQQIKRTFKLLCAVGLGKPIVGPNWVQACADHNMILDPWLFLIKDERAETRFHFSLERTLKGKRNFLKGYNVSSTPRVTPDAHEMKLIVECSGGTWKEGGPQWICVSVPEDKALWPALRSRGAIVVSPEFILGGVLRQQVEIDVNKYKM